MFDFEFVSFFFFLGGKRQLKRGPKKIGSRGEREQKRALPVTDLNMEKDERNGTARRPPIPFRGYS